MILPELGEVGKPLLQEVGLLQLPTIGELQNSGGNERFRNAGNPERLLEATWRPSPKIGNAADENIPTSIRNGSKHCNTG